MKYFLILSILITVLVPLHAQSVLPEEGSVMHNDGPRPALVVDADPSPKALKKAWSDYLDDHYDIKMKGIGLFSNKDILDAEQVHVQQLESSPVDIFTQVLKNGNGAEMKFFIRRSNDIYISRELYPEEFAAMKEMLRGFLDEYLPTYHHELVDESYDEIEDIKKDIERNESALEEMQQELKKHRQKLEEARQVLETRTKRLERVSQTLEIR